MRFNIELAGKYIDANYWVFLADGVLSFKPWRPENTLTKIHKEHRVKSSALLSAYNPRSEPTNDYKNRAANRELQKEIASKWPYYKAEGTGLGSTEKAEKSFLILGISRDEALYLGRKYEQHAIIYCHTRLNKTLPLLLSSRPTNQVIFNNLKKRFG